jgi:hypothetical protein
MKLRKMKASSAPSVATLINDAGQRIKIQLPGINNRWEKQIIRAVIAGLFLLLTITAPASAQTNGTSVTSGLSCNPPTGLEPLFNFLNSITELAFLGGVFLATLTFVVAGIAFIWPGQDYNRLGKKIATNGFFGTVLLLSANMITSWIVSNFPGVC